MRMGRRIGLPFCCCSYGYLRCCARSDRAATRSCLHYGVRGCTGSRTYIPGGGKNKPNNLRVESRNEIHEKRDSSLNTAIVKSSERRSRSCHVESARFQTKCSCEAPSVNE